VGFFRRVFLGFIGRVFLGGFFIANPGHRYSRCSEKARVAI
jgi:hypothetical protein